MVHTGVVPALYAMPTHCQVTEIKNSLMLSESHSSHHHAMHEMHHGQHSQPTQHDQLSDYAKEVFALASQIMKHCPLCTHGLDAVAIIPLIAFMPMLYVVRRSAYSTYLLYFPD